MDKYILSLILTGVLLAAFTACSFDPDTTIFDDDDDDDDDNNDNDDSANYETHDELCETYEICTPAHGTYMCMVTKDNVSPNIPRCNMNGEGCDEGQVPLMITFGDEPECGCVTICGKGSGKYGDSACDVAEWCRLQGTIFICLENGDVPSDTNLCNVNTLEGCNSDEIPMMTEYEGNPVCVCLQGC